MITSRPLLRLTGCAVVALLVAFLLSGSIPIPIAFAEPPAPAQGPQAPQAGGPFVTWPTGNWPPYAQGEIFVSPEPPIAGEPTRIAAMVVNTGTVTGTAVLIFRVAPFGIGTDFAEIGRDAVMAPPGGRAVGETVWVPPQPGRWCFEVVLKQLDAPGLVLVSQRNVDVWESLTPGLPANTPFLVRNPLTVPLSIQLGFLANPDKEAAGWSFFVTPTVANLAPGQPVMASLVVTPPAQSQGKLGDRQYLVDVEATAVVGQDPRLIGGFRKFDWPPVPLHDVRDPVYAEREISVTPYPPVPGEPARMCVQLRNLSPLPQTVAAEFSVTALGIGLPWRPVGIRQLDLPPFGMAEPCVVWIPPELALAGDMAPPIPLAARQFGVRVDLFDLTGRYQPQTSSRVLDVNEVFHPGQPTKLIFAVRNPFSGGTVDIDLAVNPHLPGWQVGLDTSRLLNVQPGEARPVTLTVTPPPNVPLPADEMAVVDVEATTLVGQDPHLIGGFRKVYRPPVPIHRPGDPVYAESEISIQPYPPRPKEPTEICVDLRNPTGVSQTVTVTFAVATFGIGLPFHDIARPIAVELAPYGIRRVCITWVPPFGGKFCARVTLQVAGHTPVWSQRNMDVDEVLRPGHPATLVFPVGNFDQQSPVTVTLGIVPRLPGWGATLSDRLLTNLGPGEVRPVTLTVTPPVGVPMPEDVTPVVDVEGYAGPGLFGGFRKIYRPPVPIHRPGDPVYAESEIYVDPYPVWEGQPTQLGLVVNNPTLVSQTITVTFQWAPFGIGLPFSESGMVTPTMVINIPPLGAARARTVWIPPIRGLFCVKVILQVPGHEPVESMRNIDVGEPLRPDQAHQRLIQVGNPFGEVITVTMGLVSHRPGWTVAITPTVLPGMLPGELRAVTLTVQPPSWLGLADENPVADVEAYASGGSTVPDGTLIGGIRKIAKPPVPLHKPQDRPYAESEIAVTPDPIVAGKVHTITTAIANTSDVTQVVRVEFSVANFGVGIPFTSTNIVPTYRVVTVTPGLSLTVDAQWTPPSAGHWCIQIMLFDAEDNYPPQRSQRNVDVERRTYLPCQPFTKEFLLQNSTSQVVTVTIGSSAINLPLGWTWSTDITETVLIPFQAITVTVTITPPCGTGAQAALPLALDTGGASGPPTIDVEGYVDGALQGGVQIQLELAPASKIYLPLVLRGG